MAVPGTHNCGDVMKGSVKKTGSREYFPRKQEAGHSAHGRSRDNARGRSAGRRGGRAYGASEYAPKYTPDDSLYSPDASLLPQGAILDMQALFPMLSVERGRDISVLLGQALKDAFPLKKAHRQDLPYNIVQLSRLLTVERSEMRHPYWASPALTGAYVHYFLPWNIYRLSRLFSGLRLATPPDDGRYLLLDLGSGPMTVPVALWLSCPEWRSKKIVVCAVDCAGHPLQIGKAILESLAKQAGTEPWEVVPVQAPLEQGIRRAGQIIQKGCTPWLVTAANVLNELEPLKKVRLGDDDESDFEKTRLHDITGMVSSLLRHAPKEARALFIEPGTRLGGLTLMGVRSMLKDEGMHIEAPCPHNGICPLYRGDDPEDMDVDDLFMQEGDQELDQEYQSREQQGQVSKLAGRSWCHFTFTSTGAPSWLRALAEPTGLAKETLSLSFLLFSAAKEGQPDEMPDAQQNGQKTCLRIISQPFSVPRRKGQCRYACSEHGLILLEDAAKYASGTKLSVSQTGDDVAKAPQDARSGARCLSVDGSGHKGTEVPGNGEMHDLRHKNGPKQYAGSKRNGAGRHERHSFPHFKGMPKKEQRDKR